MVAFAELVVAGMHSAEGTVETAGQAKVGTAEMVEPAVAAA